MSNLQHIPNDNTHAQPAANIDLLRSLNFHLNLVREEEQGALARRIHDDLSQTLTAIQMEFSIIVSKSSLPGDAAVNLLHVKELLANLTDATREIINTLRPPILDDFGIVAGLEWLSSRFHASAGFECIVKSEPDEIHLSSDCKTVIYQIVEEALRNVARHASAHSVTVSLTGSSNVIRLVVSDDGTGFKPHMDSEVAAGKFGLFQMRERVTYLGGEISIESSPDIGTSIIVQIPELPGGSL